MTKISCERKLLIEVTKNVCLLGKFDDAHGILLAFRRHNNQPIYQRDERGASAGRYPAIGASILAAAVGGPLFRGIFLEQNFQSDESSARKGRIFARDVLPNQASVTKSKGTVWQRIA